MVDLVVLVPTRDEAANVAAVVRHVSDSLALAPFSWELVFVDDSDDETVGVLAGLAALFPGSRCCTGPRATARVDSPERCSRVWLPRRVGGWRSWTPISSIPLSSCPS